MKKSIIWIACFILATFTSQAQEFKLGFGVNGQYLVSPSGAGTDGLGGGLSIIPKYFFNPNVSIGAQLGYHTLASGDISMIPITINTDYYAGTGSTKFIIGADLGITQLSGGGGSGSATTLAPHIGVQINNFGIELQYRNLSNNGVSIGFVGLQFNYLFGFGGGGNTSNSGSSSPSR